MPLGAGLSPAELDADGDKDEPLLSDGAAEICSVGTSSGITVGEPLPSGTVEAAADALGEADTLPLSSPQAAKAKIAASNNAVVKSIFFKMKSSYVDDTGIFPMQSKFYTIKNGMSEFVPFRLYQRELVLACWLPLRMKLFDLFVDKGAGFFCLDLQVRLWHQIPVEGNILGVSASEYPLLCLIWKTFSVKYKHKVIIKLQLNIIIKTKKC